MNKTTLTLAAAVAVLAVHTSDSAATLASVSVAAPYTPVTTTVNYPVGSNSNANDVSTSCAVVAGLEIGSNLVLNYVDSHGNLDTIQEGDNNGHYHYWGDHYSWTTTPHYTITLARYNENLATPGTSVGLRCVWSDSGADVQANAIAVVPAVPSMSTLTYNNAVDLSAGCGNVVTNYKAGTVEGEDADTITTFPYTVTLTDSDGDELHASSNAGGRVGTGYMHPGETMELCPTDLDTAKAGEYSGTLELTLTVK